MRYEIQFIYNKTSQLFAQQTFSKKENSRCIDEENKVIRKKERQEAKRHFCLNNRTA